MTTLCRNGLHDKSLPGGRTSQGECKPCWKAGMARYRRTDKGRAAAARAQTRYEASPKGIAARERARRRKVSS